MLSMLFLTNMPPASNIPPYKLAIRANLPLTLSNIDFNNASLYDTLPDYQANAVLETINTYCDGMDEINNDPFGSGCFFKTVVVQNSNISICIVLLNQFVFHQAAAYVLFFDTEQKKLLPSVFPFKIYASYEIFKNNLIQTYLKKHFQITAPDLELIEKNEQYYYQTQRLYHNGTFNQIELTQFKIYKDSVSIHLQTMLPLE